MRSRTLLSQLSLKPYRVCPDCDAKYAPDAKTRKRQIPIIIMALVAFGLTAAVGLKGSGWLLPAVVSHIAMWAYIGYTVSHVRYEKYPD